MVSVTLTLVNERGGRGIRLRDFVAAVLFVLVVIMGFTAGWMGGSMSITPKTSTQTTTPPVAASSAAVVNLAVIPDWGGAGYDAFVIPSHANGTAPSPATKTTGPGPNDNNITVPVNASVTFVITNLDTAVNLNYTGNVTLPFTIYNDTASGQVPVQYSVGESVVKLPVAHTFVVAETDVNIPIPPDTIVTFNVTFTKPGTYLYFCTAPCGPGMGLVGYMEGYIIVA